MLHVSCMHVPATSIEGRITVGSALSEVSGCGYDTVRAESCFEFSRYLHVWGSGLVGPVGDQLQST